ncbi:MAG: hypothetical protein PHE60_03095 [Sulfurospirillaceae bacterium]|nr:hypothetical protein [Sulfurospirillaceae bacterium]
MKKIIIVPPNGKFKSQDFFIHRLSEYLYINNYEAKLVKIKEDFDEEICLSIPIISLDNVEHLLFYLTTSNFDLIIHRCWMHSYSFAALLSQHCSNVVFYIKDWFAEISREQYKLIYHTDSDYDGIKTLFESNKKILTHYTMEYIIAIWSKKYCIDINNFTFFPEYTIKSKHHIRINTSYDSKNVKLLLLGSLFPTCNPTEICNQRQVLNDIKLITSQKIQFDRMVLEKTYDNVMNSPLYIDYKYEHLFNSYFNIIQGSAFNSKDTEYYHFGVYQLLDVSNYDSKDANSTLHAVVSKFANYLEAGLPILVNENFKYISAIVKKYDIGIVISNNEAKDLKCVLNIEEGRYQTLISNVYIFRDMYSYNFETLKSILS